MLQVDGLDGQSVECLGMGVFDGMHLGHLQLQKQCDALLSFHPHPAVFFGRADDLRYITTPEERRFYQERLFVLNFDSESSSLSARQFLDEIVGAQISPRKIVVGYDYRFGKGAEGDVAFLKTWGADNSVEIGEIVPFKDKTLDVPVKSSVIRRYFREDFDTAIRLLGHSYLMMGRVVRGEGRGRGLGFPTANLELDPMKLIPGYGVYGGSVDVDGRPYKAAVYIGEKPTFEGKVPTVEVHILGFEGDLYGRDLSVFLERKIRGEMKFETSGDLVNQIREDVLKV